MTIEDPVPLNTMEYDKLVISCMVSPQQGSSDTDRTTWGSYSTERERELLDARKSIQLSVWVARHPKRD